MLCLSNLDIKAMNDIELHYGIGTGLIRRGGDISNTSLCCMVKKDVHLYQITTGPHCSTML